VKRAWEPLKKTGTLVPRRITFWRGALSGSVDVMMCTS
jgi:hypothetical protein